MSTDLDRCQIEGCYGYADWLVKKHLSSFIKHVCRACRDEMIACYGYELTNEPATVRSI